MYLYQASDPGQISKHPQGVLRRIDHFARDIIAAPFWHTSVGLRLLEHFEKPASSDLKRAPLYAASHFEKKLKDGFRGGGGQYSFRGAPFDYLNSRRPQ